jgi:hypothetical protein
LITGAEGLGFGALGVMASPILGQKGNREFFIHWRFGSSSMSPGRLEDQIKEALRNEDH